MVSMILTIQILKNSDPWPLNSKGSVRAFWAASVDVIVVTISPWHAISYSVQFVSCQIFAGALAKASVAADPVTWERAQELRARCKRLPRTALKCLLVEKI